MNTKCDAPNFQIEQFLCDLIAIKSVTGGELEVLNFVTKSLESFGFEVQKLAVEDNRYNIYCPVGHPNICFTTHLDVVPAPDNLFVPKIEDGKIIGRGACDAKGMVAAMIGAAIKLKNEGYLNFALLFVVGEETDGIGAKSAVKQLGEKAFKYVVNGEPTECKLIKAHKGGVTFNVTTIGKSVHSGYPDRGVDANVRLLQIANDLLAADFGEDEVLGRSTINLGKIDAGTASNIVSDRGLMRGMIRAVTDSQVVVDKLNAIVGDRGQVEIIGFAPKVELKTLPGFETDIVNYCTDIPYLLPLAPEFLLYGPGSIFEAHTTHEFIEIKQLHRAVEDYVRIYSELIAPRA